MRLLIPCAQPGSSLAMEVALRPLYSPQPSSASAEEVPGRARVGTPISRMPYTGDRSQSIPVCQKVMPTVWAGAAGPAASFLSPSPGAPAGWGQLQLDCPLSNQLGTLELGHKCGQNHWCLHCSCQLSVFPVVFPSSLSMSLPFLGSHLLSSSCSCAGILPHSLPVLAAHCQHQGHPTLGSPHAGAELSQGQTRAVMLKDSTSTGPQPSRSGTPMTLGGQCGTGSSAVALEKLLLGPGGLCLCAA